MAKARSKSPSGKKKTKAKKTAKRSTTAKKKPVRAVKKRAAKRPARKSTAAPSPALRKGTITHTELASSDPRATQAWCENVLGWKFAEPMAMENGSYHMWRFANGTGGGIRSSNPPELPGSTPYCEVASIRETFSEAIEAGATEMLAPTALPSGMGWIAIVSAPGGVPIGFWAPK